MSELTELEINCYLHTEIMGKCWHEFGPKCFDPSDRSKTGYVCPKCRRFFREPVEQGPDYCSAKSPREYLEEVVAEVVKVGSKSFEQQKSDKKWLWSLPLDATAKDIATACVAAWKEKNND